MGADLWLGIALAGALTIVIAIIEVIARSKVNHPSSCLGSAFAIYLAVMLTGNLASTLAAAATIQALTAGPPGGGVSPAVFSVLPWFWYAFFGVFAFEALLQRINITFADQGFLTINDWIHKARDAAVAAAIESQVDSQLQREQALSSRLHAAILSIPSSALNTHVANMLGSARLAELTASAAATNGDLRLTLCYALATQAFDRAAKL